ncbi:hypothetical protein G6011_06866 [Alternaria panax]|uniref:Uncharacterized protein n=1 Tax=Alternaria panax TaxID=48097 RepID=A0AAD4I1G7_9PLEO|nr:hypothetical protein G6011_06866 [Alternaria panax]
MSSQEAKILGDFLLAPAPLRDFITLRDFTDIFPRAHHASPAVHEIYRELQRIRDRDVELVRRDIADEVKRSKQLRREYARERRRIDEASVVGLDPVALRMEEELSGAQSRRRPHTLQTMRSDIEEAFQSLEAQIAEMEQEDKTCLAEVQDVVGALSELRHGRFAPSSSGEGIGEEVVATLKRLEAGIQLRLIPQDVMGEIVLRQHFGFQVHLNHQMGSYKAMAEFWEEPMMPDNIQQECYKPPIEIFNAMHPWANQDGFAEQWIKLAKDPKVAGHPVFRMMNKNGEKYCFYKHHPLLSGVMEHHFFIHRHAAGHSHNATSCSLFFMAHVYMGTQLRSPSDPTWPGMEVMLFSQNPRYVLLKRPPESPAEARTLFDLATGQPTVKQSRLFRNASVFGDTVYLPRGAGSCWIKKVPGGAFSVEIDTIATALLVAYSPDVTRGRLAHAMRESQEVQGIKLEPLNRRDGLTSFAILQHFAFRLQADIPDVCFNTTLMQQQCSDTWKAIYAALERDLAWDPSWSQFGQSPQHTANAIVSTFITEERYPRFMDIARRAMRKYLQQQDSELECPRSEACLKDMMKYHKKTAQLFTDDGLLSVDSLYSYSHTRHAIKATVALAEDSTENADSRAMFQARAMAGISQMLENVMAGNSDDCTVM